MPSSFDMWTGKPGYPAGTQVPSSAGMWRGEQPKPPAPAPLGGATQGPPPIIGGAAQGYPNLPSGWTPPPQPYTGAPITGSALAGAQMPPAQPQPNFDLSQPGAYEQQWDATKGFFAQPTNSQQAYDQYGGMFQSMAAAPGPQFSAQAYGDFRSGVPQDAGLGAYYDQQWNKGSERLNREFGARGAFNSSAATRGLGELATGLGAEEANRSADFRLRRAGVGGQLAGAASGEQLAGTGQRMGAAQAGAGLAGDADSAALQRVVGGLSGANTAQQSREGRIGDAYTRISGAGTQQADALLSTVNQMIQQDAEFAKLPFEIQMAVAQAQMQAQQAQASNTLGLAGTLVGGLTG